MELKWLEDFVCVTEKGHFARAAEARFVTQSALSRRIKSLENWLGTELLDRSQHPIAMTAAGKDFLNTAQEIISRTYEARAQATVYSGATESSITISCLHTLALNYIPDLIKDAQQKISPFEVSVIAETRTIEEYLTGLFNRTCDFFICYFHDAIPFGVDEEQFPHIDIDTHHIKLYQNNNGENFDLSSNSKKRIPLNEYSGTSYMSRVIELIRKNAPFSDRLKPIYRASLAESLFSATSSGFGMSWLPSTIVNNNPKGKGLKVVSEKWSTEIKIRVYRSASNNRKVVEDLWNFLEEKSLQNS